MFDEPEGEVKITLGDDRIPIGLWKAIEHMRRGEKSLISIKPKWAFGREEIRDILIYPPCYDTPEKREII